MPVKTLLAVPTAALGSRRNAARVMSVGVMCTGTGSGQGARGAGWRSVSKRTDCSCMPPTPSVIAWLNFVISAARPSSTPSTSVNSHSGRVVSSGAISVVSTRSRTSRNVPGAGARIRRTW